MFDARFPLFLLLTLALPCASEGQSQCSFSAPISVIATHGAVPAPKMIYMPLAPGQVVPEVSATTENGGDWITISLSAPIASSLGARVDVTVRVNGDNLTPGVYTGRINVWRDLRAGSPCSIPVTLRQDQDAISLEHTTCFGDCPMYLLRIEPSGAVFFRNGPADNQDHHTSTITAGQYRELLKMFDQVHFFESKDAMYPSSEDGPSNVLTLTSNGQTKSITCFDCGPPEMRELGWAIERTANTHRWRHGDARRMSLRTPLTGPGMAFVEDLKVEMFVRDDVNTRTKPGMTVLMQAAGQGDAATVRRELAAGADVNAADETGWTALMLAASMLQPQTAAMLLEAGARVDQRDVHGDTALLGLSGARFNNLRLVPQVADVLLSHGAAVDAVNNLGESALMWASHLANIELMDLLLKAGADPGRVDQAGLDALRYLRQGRQDYHHDPSVVSRYDRAEKVLLQGIAGFHK
jgi:uncharacterized protein